MRGLTYLAAAAAATTVLSLITLAAARPPAVGMAPVHSSAAVKQTGNWAGYVAVAANPGIKMHFIAAEFRVPAISCAKSLTYDGRQHPYSQAAFWVGLGGYGGNGHRPLEQAGIFAQCWTKNSAPQYSAFWEVLPRWQNVQIVPITGGTRSTVKANDLVTVIVQDNANNVSGTGPGANSPAGYSYDLEVIDDSAGYAQWPRPGYVNLIPQGTHTDADATAEVITEALSNGLDSPYHIGIADMGTVSYSMIQAGSITSHSSHGMSAWKEWSTTTVTLGGESVKQRPWFYPGIIATGALHDSGGKAGPGSHSFSTYWTGLP